MVSVLEKKFSGQYGKICFKSEYTLGVMGKIDVNPEESNECQALRLCSIKISLNDVFEILVCVFAQIG